MIQWHLEVRSIAQLKPHPKNPRNLSKEQFKHLKQSIDSFGLIDKPIINTDNTIIGGHQRIEILKKMKAKNVECWIPDHPLTDAQIDELNIRLNKNTGDWDWDILANEWELPELVEWGFKADDFYDAPFPLDKNEDEEEKEKNVITCPHCGAEI